jgi:hypothetical protein
LVISKQFYESLGGHSDQAADPDRALLRRIGRRRRVVLSTAVFGPE